MTDIPTFKPGSAEELCWAKAVVRNRKEIRKSVSGPAIIRMAKKIVAANK
jgi:hypothetical protein